MSMWIKICGVTRPEDADLAVQLGANSIGFVMHTPSPRRCDVETARSIIRNLTATVASIGVWFDETAEEIAPLAEHIGCQIVQTYDLVAAHELRKQGFAVLPALAMPIDDAMLNVVSLGEYVIIDTARWHPKSRTAAADAPGINPAISAWSALQSSKSLNDTKFVLAGGLNCENIFSALEEFRPDGVDAASGLESAPGVKDREKMTRFVEVIREWSEKASSARTAADSYPKR